ncbi:hypothetical protein AGR6A_Cc140215 [Agrobacterium sp. NCPPB 925]|nr:hypothetical protein AGR6A_Cc140215 [Agrobacterium sp. NCPPB 925]
MCPLFLRDTGVGTYRVWCYRSQRFGFMPLGSEMLSFRNQTRCVWKKIAANNCAIINSIIKKYWKILMVTF